MKSLIASLRELTLPFGATSGTRIIIDGVTGTITVFDENDDLRIRIGAVSPDPTGTIEVSSGSANEELMGNLQASGQGTPGTTEQFLTSLNSPKAENRERAVLDLISESVDGTVETRANLFADLLAVLDGGGGTGANLTVNGFSLPRGVLARDRIAANVTFSTETQIAQLAEVTFISGRRYRLELSWRSLVWNSAAANATARLRIKDLASTVRAECLKVVTGATGREGGTMMVALDCPGEIASGAHTFEATAERVTGAGTLDVEAAGTGPITLTVEDVGATING